MVVEAACLVVVTVVVEVSFDFDLDRVIVVGDKEMYRPLVKHDDKAY